MANEILLTKGRDGEFTIDLTDGTGKQFRTPDPITFAQVRLPAQAGGSVDIFSPLTPGVNEIQNIDFDVVPDEGTFKLQAGSEITTVLNFDADAAAIQAALRALTQFSALTVAAGDDFDVSFVGDDGGRSQPLLVAVQSTLKNTGTDTVVTIKKTTTGKGENGVDIIDSQCPRLRCVLSEDQLALIRTGNNQDIEPIVRQGAKDLNIPILKDVLKVEAVSF